MTGSPLLTRIHRLFPILAAVCIAIYFLGFTAPSLGWYFSTDDSMNLYRSWYWPLGSLIKANFVFFLNSTFYRPLVSAWYRSIYYFAGFNPAPFHAIILMVVLANTWLAYAVCRRLTGSREIGAIAAVLVSFHPSLAALYVDTGFAYDAICFFFYFSAFLFYLRIRQQKLTEKTWELVVFLLLFICALNSKEMAVTLPACLAIYEILYNRVPLASRKRLWQWIKSEGGLLAAAAVVALMFLIGRGLDRSNSLLSIGPYIPVFSWDRFMTTSRNFPASLFIRRDPLSAPVVLGIWSATLAVALVARSRPLLFAWLFLMLSPLPIAFILPRGPAQYYIPFFGWVLFAAIVVVSVTQFLLRPLGWLRAPAVFLASMLVLMHYYRRPWTRDLDSMSLGPEQQRSIVQQLHALRPALHHGSRILFLNDPYDDQYRMMFLVALSYRDPSLNVESAKFMKPTPNASQIAAYDYVFDYHLGRFYTSAQPRPPGPEPVITFDWGQPDIFHENLKRLTPLSPARPGEMVIAMVQDLGDTNPKIPPGQPFPQDPLLNVVAPVGVRVGGRPAEVIRKISWPQQVNRYRVDFDIPKDVRPGEVNVEITASGVTGPAVAIPVR